MSLATWVVGRGVFSAEWFWGLESRLRTLAALRYEVSDVLERVHDSSFTCGWLLFLPFVPAVLIEWRACISFSFSSCLRISLSTMVSEADRMWSVDRFKLVNWVRTGESDACSMEIKFTWARLFAVCHNLYNLNYFIFKWWLIWKAIIQRIGLKSTSFPFEFWISLRVLCGKFKWGPMWFCCCWEDGVRLLLIL